MKEFNLSEKIQHLKKPHWYEGAVGIISTKDVKEFIRLLKEEDSDWIEDILDLIEIHKGSKLDLVIKMKRLCMAHYKEKVKLAGDKLV